MSRSTDTHQASSMSATRRAITAPWSPPTASSSTVPAITIRLTSDRRCGCPRRYTYGVGATFAWSTTAGWALGFGMGMAIGSWCSPWWGPVGYWGWGCGSSGLGMGRMGRCRRSQRLWPLGQHCVRGDARGLGESLDRQRRHRRSRDRTTTRSPATAATRRTEKTTTPTPATTPPDRA